KFFSNIGEALLTEFPGFHILYLDNGNSALDKICALECEAIDQIEGVSNRGDGFIRPHNPTPPASPESPHPVPRPSPSVRTVARSAAPSCRQTPRRHRLLPRRRRSGRGSARSRVFLLLPMRRNSRSLEYFRSPYPHPGPLPKGEGEEQSRCRASGGRSG